MPVSALKDLEIIVFCDRINLAGIVAWSDNPGDKVCLEFNKGGLLSCTIVTDNPSWSFYKHSINAVDCT